MSNGNAQGMPSWFTDIINLAGGYYTGDQAAKAAAEAGVKSAQEATELGEEAAGMAKFQPYTVTTGTGSATTTPEGGFTLNLTPEQKAMSKELFGQAGALFGIAGSDPTQAIADTYESIRALQRPEEERKRLALEERMLSQGRLGLQSAAYGGANPEMLAQEQALADARLKASLGARETAMAERKQAFDLGTGLLKSSYTPETMGLEALGLGIESAKIPDIGRRTGAELFAQLGGEGLEALMQGVQLSTGLEELTRQQLVDNIIGSISGGGSGSGMLGIDIDAELEDLVPSWLSGLIDYFTPTDYGTPVTGVEEIVPTGYDENGNPTYD
jgi:hypothetical protein